jgi:uncharacterized protein
MTQRLMKFLYRKSFVVFMFLFTLVPAVAFAYSSPGNPSGYVNDFAGVFTPEQKSMLENKLSAFNASTTNEIAVVTVKSLGGDYIENYAVQLFKEWGIGTKKNDNGVLLLIALDDHKMRIEVGYGLEGALTDSLASQIIRNDLAPAFKQNDFYGGVNIATDHIIEATKGEYKNDGSPDSGKKLVVSIEGVLIFVVVVFQFLASILGRSKSWWAGGVVGGIAGVALTFFHVLGITLVLGTIVTVILVFLGLLFDYVVSNRYTQAVSSGSPIPWWIGGRGGIGGGGSSSFGGFSGGSSGGGGASGSW